MCFDRAKSISTRGSIGDDPIYTYLISLKEASGKACEIPLKLSHV